MGDVIVHAQDDFKQKVPERGHQSNLPFVWPKFALTKKKGPAKNAPCNKCKKTGHFANLCHCLKTAREVTAEEPAFLGVMESAEDDEWRVR